ncbi:sensor histidine kinase [Oceanobacillus iheyensis]|uniref:sensor histidine kinase n=1 Tax=Oceanobacillus iheyensis TaxID=182710 RepID=UPI00363CD03A
MKSLYVKFIVITIGIMLLSGLIAFFLSNTYYQHKLKPYNDEKNTNIALQIANFIDKNPQLDIQHYLKNITDVGYQLYLVRQDGKEEFFGAAFRETKLSDEIIKDVIQGDIYHGMLHFPQETFVTGFFANELENSVGVPLSHNGEYYGLFIRPDIKLLFNEMHLLFGWLFALTITFSILMVLLSAKYLVNPITKLTQATKSLATGNYHIANLDVKRRDELGVLSQNFASMAKEIEQTENVRKEFISNVSHDIQSPLSNIKGYTNLLNEKNLSEEQRYEYISIIAEEVGRLSSLSKQLLLLASLDRDKDIVKKEPFNLGNQITNLIRSYQWSIQEKELMLSYSLPEIEVNGDSSLLNTVWDNILSNAVKYTSAGGFIDIQLTLKGNQVVVTFQDNGIGIPENNIERIYDRFYRVDTARTKLVEGSGLGLSIASTIVQLHDGQIHVSSKLHEGSMFSVVLPTNK